MPLAWPITSWERRYGVLRPARTAGGYRLYSAADEDRARHPGALADAARVLGEHLDQFNEPAAQAALDQLFAQYTVETVLRDVVMPYLRDLGRRWADGTVSVAAEHLATNLLRGRLAGLAQGWGSGTGPRAVLACAPGEQHDLALICFGIVLHRNGWRLEYLGADTPIEDVAHTASAASADLAVLAAALPGRFDPFPADLARLAALVPLAIAGVGATQAMADLAGARLLAGDPVTEAELMPAPPVSGSGHREGDGDS